MSDIVELFGLDTEGSHPVGWRRIVTRQSCPYLQKTCIKTQKSEPSVAIGTCTVRYGAELRPIVICPHRLLERKQVFTDCLHLLSLHEPGNELHVVSEVHVPGGSVDYVLVSSRNGRVADFVAIELQTIDTTGTVWPARQRFLQSQGLRTKRDDADSAKAFGMNWKMTAKTTLIQLHHKIATFEGFAKHLVLVIQDELLLYMRREFAFSHLAQARLGDPMHFHAYALTKSKSGHRLVLVERMSTDANGIASCMGLQASQDVALEEIVRTLEAKMSPATLLTI